MGIIDKTKKEVREYLAPFLIIEHEVLSTNRYYFAKVYLLKNQVAVRLIPLFVILSSSSSSSPSYVG